MGIVIHSHTSFILKGELISILDFEDRLFVLFLPGELIAVPLAYDTS